MAGDTILRSEVEFEQFVPSFDYIKPYDYIRPVFGAAVLGLALSILVSFLGGLIGGAYVAGVIFGFCIFIYMMQLPMAFFVSALVRHQLMLHRLRKYGPAWYLRQRQLDLPQAEAFELCLAACAQFKRARISTCDEINGIIHLQIKGNFWITGDRTVALVLKAKNGQSVLYIDSKVRMTKFRGKFIRMLWGEKWHPIVSRTDRNHNFKLMNTISTFIDSVPNWDHRHISVQEQLENLDQHIAVSSAASPVIASVDRVTAGDDTQAA